jgi:hypothetical protein
LPFLNKPSLNQNIRYLNMPLETNAGDILQLNIWCPYRICFSMTSRLDTIKTRFWEKKSQKWSDEIFTWHSKLPAPTRHPPKNSKRTPSWAWSPRPWPPTCSLNTTMGRSGTTTTLRWRTFHHGGSHFSKIRSESKNKTSGRNLKGDSKKINLKESESKKINIRESKRKRNLKGESQKKRYKKFEKGGQTKETRDKK